MTSAATTIRDRLIADAKDVPSLIAAANTEDPALAQALTGKALIYSKTVWAVPIMSAVSWLVSHYALNWDQDTQTLVVFMIGTGTAWVMRVISKGPITSVM